MSHVVTMVDAPNCRVIIPTDDLLPEGYRFVPAAASSDRGAVQLGTAGHFGAVYLAVNDVLQRHVAVKVVPRSESSDRWSSVTSIREAQTLAQLNHPNIVRVYDLVERDGADLIVMELVPGGTLGDLIGRAEPPRKDRLRLVAEAAAGLAYLHRCGIVHRDIKPANILVSEAGVAKIADFGLVTTADVHDDPLRDEISQAIAGTPGHWSPEQSRGEPLGPQSDVFSLATVALQLLSGHPGETDRRPRRRHPSITDVLQRCLAVVPSARPSDGARMYELLCAAADRESNEWRHATWRPLSVRAIAPPPAVVPESPEIETIAPDGDDRQAAMTPLPTPTPAPAPVKAAPRPHVERLVVRSAATDDRAAAALAPQRKRWVRRTLMLIAGAALGAAAGILISARL